MSCQMFNMQGICQSIELLKTKIQDYVRLVYGEEKKQNKTKSVTHMVSVV